MRLLLVLIALLVFQPRVFAQQQEWWDDGCDSRAIALIEPVEGVFDYAGTCETYRQCDPNNEGVPICQLIALDSFLEACAPEDTHCEQSAMLYAAATQTFDTPYSESVYEIPTQEVIENVPRGLEAFQSGDVTGALAAFEQISPDEFNAMPPFSRGLIQAALGNSEAALAEYDSAMKLVMNVPLVRYARAQLYGELGRTDEASFDVEWLRQYVQGYPEAEALVAPLVAAYPIDPARLEDWLMYPLISRSMGPGGDFFTDQTQAAPRPVQLAFYDELDMLLALGLSPAFRGEEGTAFADMVLLAQMDNGYEFSRTDDMFDAGMSVHLTAVGGVFVGRADLYFFEGAVPYHYLLAPADAPDPRADLHAQRCGVISRLRPGMTLINPHYGGGLFMLDAPAGNQVGEFENGVALAESVCQNDVLWWHVRRDDGLEGWVAENEGADYTLNPSSTEAMTDSSRKLIPFYCPDTPTFQLFAGATGRVTAGLGANNLRTTPDTDGDIVTQMPPDAEFTVMDGPVCADGFVWWQVDYGGAEGWTAEGEGDTYWLEPVLT